jgi:hypothetical protein
MSSGLLFREPGAERARKRDRRLVRCTFDIDGDRIARRKRLVEGLVEQLIHVPYGGWRGSVRFSRKTHDVGAFFFT